MPKYEDKTAVVETPKARYNSGTKSVQSVFPAHLKYTGVSSGKLYEWYKSGDVVSVDDADVDDLIAKRIGQRGCCGDNLYGNPVFILFTS